MQPMPSQPPFGRPAPEPAEPRHLPAAPPEPATPVALWPTFMRRTLAESVVEAAEPA